MTCKLPPPPCAGFRRKSRRAGYGHLPRQRADARAGRGGASLRFGAVILLCLGLSACGFHPLYGGGGPSSNLSSIYVEPVSGGSGYELRNTLIDLLGSNGEARGKAYRLQITLDETAQGVALQNDAAITRYNDSLEVDYVLTDADGKVLTKGSQSGLSTYNVATSPYATLAAQQDSDKHAADDIADRIRTDLGVYFAGRGR